MNVILLEKVPNLGLLGEKVHVKAGYGRNFLIPQGKAVRATDANLEHFEARRKELEEKAADKLTEAKEKAQELASIEIEIAARAGDEGKLFGSITVREVVDALTKKGIVVKKTQVSLPDGSIRNIGEYEVLIQLHTDVEAPLQVRVVEEK